MRWKDLLIGAIITLAVTIVGGIIVYYATKEPTPKSAENLVYSVRQSGSFKGGTQIIALTYVDVINSGAVAAKHVKVSAAFENADVRDFAVESNTGMHDVHRELKSKSIDLEFETLLPSETFTLSLLLSSQERPTVVVRSDASLGVKRSLEPIIIPKKDRISKFLELAVPGTGGVLAVVAGIVFARFRRLGLLEGSDRNNAAFVLLHNGFVSAATDMLWRSVNAGRYDNFVLSNLATCMALQDKNEDAMRLIRATTFTGHGISTRHAKAVVLFNEAIILAHSGDQVTAMQTLEKAITLSSDIRKYCEGSVQVDSLRALPKFKALVHSP